MLRSLASAPWCSCYRSQLGFPTSARERDRALVVPIRYEQGAHVLLTRLVALAFLLVLLACSRGGDALPGLGINVGETSVSGLSAGAYMAGQLQVAHSEQIVGAGIVAGGPFGCAESQANNLLPTIANNLSQAFEECLNGRGIPNTAALVERAKGLAAAGEIDPLADLSKDRVYLFSGGKDRVVDRSVVEAAKRFYIDAGVPQENVALMTRDDAGHSILTNDTGNACGLSASPFVSDCDYDQSGAILQWIYGELNAPAERPKGRFLIFDQSPYAETGNGLSSEARGLHSSSLHRPKRLSRAHRLTWLRAKSRSGGHDFYRGLRALHDGLIPIVSLSFSRKSRPASSIPRRVGIGGATPERISSQRRHHKLLRSGEWLSDLGAVGRPQTSRQISKIEKVTCSGYAGTRLPNQRYSRRRRRAD